MSTNPQHGVPTSMQERANNLMNKAMLTCACGSTHFYKVVVGEYKDTGNFAGRFSLNSENPPDAYICICGRPVEAKNIAVGKVIPTDRTRFIDSLTLALKYREDTSATAMLAGFVPAVAFAELKNTVETMEEQIAWLIDSVEEMNRNNAEEIDPAGTDEGDDTGADAGTTDADIEASTETAPADVPAAEGNAPATLDSLAALTAPAAPAAVISIESKTALRAPKKSVGGVARRAQAQAAN